MSTPDRLHRFTLDHHKHVKLLDAVKAINDAIYEIEFLDDPGLKAATPPIREALAAALPAVTAFLTAEVRDSGDP